MRTRRVTRVVDAVASQDRYIIWLDCNHKISYSMMQAREAPLRIPVVDGVIDATWECPFCPDPPPEPPFVAEISATKLWHDAGEP